MADRGIHNDLHSFFKSLDSDGNGKISLPELLRNKQLVSELGSKYLKQAFKVLDVYGKEYLDYGQCSILQSLVATYSQRPCSSCDQFTQLGKGYTCGKCAIKKKNPNPFTLCHHCFQLPNPNVTHKHSNKHLQHDSNIFHQIVASFTNILPPSSPQGIEQCSVCGDFHEPSVSGFTYKFHMCQFEGGYICEWCFSYFCSSCGKVFNDSRKRAEPQKLVQQFMCHDCSKNPTHAQTNNYNTHIKRLQGAVQESDVANDCKTCKIKLKNGTLFSIMNNQNPQQNVPYFEAPSQNICGYQPNNYQNYPQNVNQPIQTRNQPSIYPINNNDPMTQSMNYQSSLRNGGDSITEVMKLYSSMFAAGRNPSPFLNGMIPGGPSMHNVLNNVIGGIGGNDPSNMISGLLGGDGGDGGANVVGSVISSLFGM